MGMITSVRINIKTIVNTTIIQVILLISLFIFFIFFTFLFELVKLRQQTLKQWLNCIKKGADKYQ